MAVDTPASRNALAGLRQVPIQELVLPVVIVGLLVAGVIIKPDVFPTSDNLLNVLTQASITGIIAIGMTFVIATGGIDLSVGSVLAAASIAGGLLADNGSWMFMLGAINGLAITWGKVVPFVATLAMLTIARGLALWMSDKTPISLIDLDILQRIGSGKVLGVPVPALVFLAVTIAGWVLLNRTTFGRHTIAVGGNRSAARIAGIRSSRVVFAVYALTGLCVGISAILLSGRLASASPVVGNLVELDAIAAVVIGGTSILGGRGTVLGTVLGALLVGTVSAAVTLLGWPSELTALFIGVFILVAVGVDLLRPRRRRAL
jgi:ribose transport system permease protein